MFFLYEKDGNPFVCFLMLCKDLVSYSNITFHNNHGTSTGSNAEKWHLIDIIKVLIFTIDELMDSDVFYILQNTKKTVALHVVATCNVDWNYNLQQNI